MLLAIICGICAVISVALFIMDYRLFKQIKQEDESISAIDKFYIICPGCGKKINLSQTHVYMEDNNDRN